MNSMLSHFRQQWISARLLPVVLVAMAVFLLPQTEARAVEPAYRASGTFTAGTGNITPPYPAGMLANDVCLLAVESENQAIALTTTNGFVEVPTWSPQSAGTAATDPASRLALFWRRTVGGDAAPVVNDSGNHTTGQIHCFSGVMTSGDPWDTGAGGNDGGANDTTGTIPGATTTVPETLVVLITTSSRNANNTANCSAWTNADLTNLTERTDNTSTQGLGGGHCLATGVKATAGAYNATTVTLATSSYKGAISLALKPVPTTTLATGTDPAAATIAPGAGATDVNLFTLQTSAGTEAISSVTVNLSTNSGIALLAITDNANTVLGSTAAPLAGSNTIAVAGMTATTTLTSFKVRVTPLSHAAMPAVPGADYAITAPVTSWAGPNNHAGSDTNANALTIDNLSPAGATAASGVSGNSQTTLSWTTSAAGDFVTTAGSVIYRWTGASAGSEVPTEGSTPAFGATNGTATVACVVSSAASTALSRIDGPGSSSGECTTAALTSGQAYTYKVFQKDTHGNYDAGVAMGTLTPHGAVSAATSTVIAVPTSVPADTYTTATITVTLKDSAGTPVPGKTVTLAAGSGSSVITTISGTTDASGIASFSVTNGTTEGPITYTATDTTDSIVITQTAQVTFTAPSLCFTDDFNRSTLLETGNWTRTKSVGTTLDAEIVSNRLRLTDASGNRATAVHLQRLFPGAGNKVTAEFDLLAYGGSGADGVVLTLSDSSIAPVAGAFGGSLGYAQKSNPGSDCTTPGGCPGFAGGWIGVGLDEYGNYSNPTEGRVDGPGAQADSVTIRGSGSGQSGYNYHTQSGVLSPGIDQAVALPAVTHVGAGTLAAANGGNVTPTLPGHQTNDLLLCAATSNDNTAHSVATSGWTEVYQLAQTGSGNPRSSLFYKKAASAAETNPTFTHTGGGGIVAGCTAFRGVDTTTPFDVAYAASHYADTVNSSNVTSGSMTTVTPDAMMLFAGHINNNNSCSLSPSVTGGLTWSESLCFESNQGNDETIAIHYATQAAAGAIGPITFTGGNNDNRGVLLALRPQPAAVATHRYRVTVDHGDGISAFVTVDRDLTGTGTSYANVIPTYDAKAIVTQAAVPPYWFFSFTASTGGATNVHEIDNLTVCTAQPIATPVLDHVRIIHDGSALTCAPETVTIKACANAACSALYPNSVTVDLTGIAGATWSTDPVTFNSGQVQVTLSKPTTGTVTLGGSATAPSSMTAVCYNGATSGDCVLTYSANACAFDAVETGNNPSTPIYTKLAGTAFTVDVMALTAGVINTGFTGAVTVDLVDQTEADPGDCSSTSLASPTTYTFTGADAGRRTFTFNYANAAPDVRVRMVSGATTACSSDNFAIRPTSFNVTSPTATPIKAGTNFELDATAVNMGATAVNGYTGTALINANRITRDPGGGIISGSFAPATLTTGWISKGTTFSYSEVGNISFESFAIYDDTFAEVDRSKATPECFIDNKVGTAVAPAPPNTKDGNDKYGCYFGNPEVLPVPVFARFIPDHFALTLATITQACTTGPTPFSYFGQDGFTTVFTLTAQNVSNATTANYAGSWAKLNLTDWNDFGFAVSAWVPSQPTGVTLTTSPPSPAGTWTAGSTTVTALHQISRPTAPALPTTATVTTLPVDSDGVTLTSAVSLGTSEQRFGILRVDNAYGSELLPLRVTARTMYCASVVGTACTQWRTNTDDNCTPIAANNVAIGNFKAPLASLTISAINPIAAGLGSIVLTKPSVTGSADIALDLGTGTAAADVCLGSWTNGPSATTAAPLPYLLGNWCGTNYDKAPISRLRFGSPKAPYIYLRERY